MSRNDAIPDGAALLWVYADGAWHYYEVESVEEGEYRVASGEFVSGPTFITLGKVWPRKGAPL